MKEENTEISTTKSARSGRVNIDYIDFSVRHFVYVYARGVFRGPLHVHDARFDSIEQISCVSHSHWHRSAAISDDCVVSRRQFYAQNTEELSCSVLMAKYVTMIIDTFATALSAVHLQSCDNYTI